MGNIENQRNAWVIGFLLLLMTGGCVPIRQFANPGKSESPTSAEAKTSDKTKVAEKTEMPTGGATSSTAISTKNSNAWESEMEGLASWYGVDFNGHLTASGEVYDMYEMTAAHKTLPLHTVVKVYNLENGKDITVRINDRGPYVEGRVIDLSRKAARALGMREDGVVKVRLEVERWPKKNL